MQAATRHAVFVQRFGGGVSKDSQKLLNRLRRNILARLGQEPTQFRRERLEALLFDVNQLEIAAFGEIKSVNLAAAKDFAAQEAGFTGRMIDRSTKRGVDYVLPSVGQLGTAVMLAPMDAKLGASKITIDDALTHFGKKKAREITQIINDGVVLGSTTPEISNSVSELMGVRQNHQVDALSRTVINHASSVARKEVYAANSDILDGYEWVATLDSRTSFICGGRDGKVFQPGGPMPPAHWNCRSTTIPVVKDEFTQVKLTGSRPQKGDSTGQISAKSTYGGWLRKQSKAFQDEALGPERARLFRTGKFTVDKFVDPTGETYSLKQLKSMYPLSFENDL